MKKTLIALAAVAVSTGAMAQATISGLLDINAVNTTKGSVQPIGGASVGVKTSDLATNNGWATSNLTFTASEDLGGGLRATAVMMSDIGATNGFAARERTIGLSGGFGTVRMGRFAPAAAAGFHGFSGAGTTFAPGNIFGLSELFERQNGLVQYTSPSFNGLTVNLAYANSSSDISNLDSKNNGKQTSLHLGYAAGPLSVGFGMNDRKNKVEATAAPTAAAQTKHDMDWIGASYDLGVARVMATHVKRKDKANGVALTDIKFNSIGVAVPIGAFTVRANFVTGKNKGAAVATDNTKTTGNQLSVTYALSKRTQIYAVTGQAKIKADGAASTENTVKARGTNIGITHAF